MILIEHTCISSDISTPSRLVMIIILSSYTNLWAHVCFSGLCHHLFRQWMILYSMPSHYLNQSWHFGNWTRLSKCQRWSFVKLIKICKYPFTNPFQNFVCKMTHKHTHKWPGMRGFGFSLAVRLKNVLSYPAIWGASTFKRWHRYDFQTRRRSWWVQWVHERSHTATRHQRWRHQREWCIVGTTKSILSS